MKTFEINLMLPTAKHRHQVEEYKQKFLKEKLISISLIPGTGSLENKTFDEWLAECDDHRVGKNLPQDFVPATQFIAIRKSDNKLVGMFQIRHALTPFLERIGGHIGYSVAPDERRKGYATQMLLLGLEECKKLGIEKVRISCIKENVASAGVIKKCGGEYDGDAEYDGVIEKYNGKVFERYWIKTIRHCE